MHASNSALQSVIRPLFLTNNASFDCSYRRCYKHVRVQEYTSATCQIVIEYASSLDYTHIGYLHFLRRHQYVLVLEGDLLTGNSADDDLSSVLGDDLIIVYGMVSGMLSAFI